MAVLGIGGRLVLRRPAPDPCFISPQDLLDWNSNQILDFCPGYLSGDRVQAVGLPVEVNGIPIKPEGWAMYEGSHWYVGENRDHIENEQHKFYKQGHEDFPKDQKGDDADFYAKIGDEYSNGNEIPEDPELEYFIHVDSHTGYASFYRDRCYALQGCPGRRVNLRNVGLPMAIGPYGSATYNNAVAECFADWGEYRYSGVDDNETGISICRDVPLFTQPDAGSLDYENADIVPRGTATKGYIWEVVCGVREYSLALSAPEVDTTSVSEKFGEAVKSLVSGGGSLEFFIDRECLEEGQTNGIPLMELLLMTDKNAEAEAEFWMMTQETCDELCWGGACGPIDRCTGKIGGSLYYEANILITQTSVNVRPTELVVGTANFVTTGEIKLLQEPYGPLLQLPSDEGSATPVPTPTPTPEPTPPPSPSPTVTITAPTDFTGTTIDNKYFYSMVGQCNGQNTIPGFSWAIADGTADTWDLEMIDLDANDWLHWDVTDIPGSTTSNTEGSEPAGGTVNDNDYGTNGYGGPCPPAGTGTHRYQLTVTARDADGDVLASATATASTAV